MRINLSSAQTFLAVKAHPVLLLLLIFLIPIGLLLGFFVFITFLPHLSIRKLTKQIKKLGYPLAFEEISPNFVEDEYSAQSSAIYRSAFTDPNFSEDAKDALLQLCTATQKLSYSDKKTAIAVGESLKSLQPLVHLPAPGFGDLGTYVKPPKYRGQMKALCEIAQLHCTYSLKVRDAEQCIKQIGLFSTIISHLSQMPLYGTYGFSLGYSRALISQIKAINKMASEGVISVQAGLTACESIAPLHSPFKIFPVLYTHQLDVVRNMPRVFPILRLIIPEPGPLWQASHVKKPDYSKVLALRGILREYHHIIKASGTEDKMGSELLFACTQAENLNIRYGEKAKIFTEIEAVNPVVLMQSYLQFEAMRRMNIVAYRVAAALVDGTDWMLAVQIDGSDIDPFSGEKFLIRTTSRSVRVYGDCPDFLGINAQRDLRLAVRLDIHEALSK